MPIVSVRRFTSLSDYQRHNGRGGVQVDVDCSVPDLARYSLYNGSYAGHVIRSSSGRRFYRSIPRFALAYDRALDSYVMRDDYRFAESSYKATVSFFLGMIGVRVVFEKLMGGSKPGRFLLHAGNRKQFVLKTSGMQKPDFIAVDENGDPYALFEGKGSSDSGVKSYQIEHGKEQVEDVLSVTLTGARGVSGVMKQGVDLERHVVASGFLNRPGVRGLRDVICEIADKKANPKMRHKYIFEGVGDGCARRVAEYLNGLDAIAGGSVDERVSMGGDGIVVMVSDEYVKSFNLESD